VPEQIRLRIGNMGKAVLVSGQAYQDPKDVLNESSRTRQTSVWRSARAERESRSSFDVEGAIR